MWFIEYIYLSFKAQQATPKLHTICTLGFQTLVFIKNFENKFHKHNFVAFWTKDQLERLKHFTKVEHLICLLHCFLKTIKHIFKRCLVVKLDLKDNSVKFAFVFAFQFKFRFLLRHTVLYLVLQLPSYLPTFKMSKL